MNAYMCINMYMHFKYMIESMLESNRLLKLGAITIFLCTTLHSPSRQTRWWLLGSQGSPSWSISNSILKGRSDFKHSTGNGTPLCAVKVWHNCNLTDFEERLHIFSLNKMSGKPILVRWSLTFQGRKVQRIVRQRSFMPDFSGHFNPGSTKSLFPLRLALLI